MVHQRLFSLYTVGADLGFDMRSFQDCVAPLVGALQMSLQDNSSSTALAQNGGGNDLSNRDGESSDSDEDSSDSDGDSSNRGDWRSLNNETFVVEITLTGRNFRQHDKTNGNGSGSSINENASDDSEKVSADVARVSLEINGVTYLFEYSPQVDAAIAGEALGKQFCSRKGPELLRDYIRERNINDKAELRRVIYEGCTKPISAALVQKIEDTLFAQANGAPSSEKVIANGNSDGQSQDLANSLQELHSESGDASELVAGNG